jgi:hypothetical protein
MSDTFSHATQGGLLLLGPFLHRIRRKAWLFLLALVGGLFGALPDLIGAYGNFIEHDHWALYGSSHHGAIAQVLQYVPMYWLHLRIDSITHGPQHRWWILGERLWLEVVFWTLNLVVIWWYVHIWRRRTKGGALNPVDMMKSKTFT